jgi:hypothetical protein
MFSRQYRLREAYFEGKRSVGALHLIKLHERSFSHLERWNLRLSDRIITINSPFRIGSELVLMDDYGTNNTEANQYIAAGALRKPGWD